MEMTLTALEQELIRMIGSARGESNALRRRNLVEQLDRLGVNDRDVRRSIKHLITDHGIPIASSPCGYYTPVTPDEVYRACEYYRSYAMACLVVESRLRRCSLPELLDQVKMQFATEGAEITEKKA